MILSVAVLALLAAVPCSTMQMDRGQNPEAQKLADIEQDFWNWRMLDAPMFSTSAGETRYNDLLESFDPSVYQQRKAKVEEFQNRLQTVDRSQLDRSNRLDFDIFADFLQTFLEGARWNSYFTVNPVTFLEGVNAVPDRMQSLMPFSTIGDFENYLQRLIKLPTQIDQQIDLLRKAVSSGHTLSNMSVADVPGQIDNLVQTSIHQSPLYHPAFTSTLNDSHVSASRRLSIRSSAETAVQHINEALIRLKTYLENSYMPATRSTWGMQGWPDGQAIYQQCLKYHTSTNMTAQEVHDLGLQEVARIQGNMNAALSRLQFSGTIKEFFESVRNDPRFHKNSSEALLDMYKDYIFNLIMPKIPTLFKNFPANFPLRVEPITVNGLSAYYQAGTLDGSVPGTFYVNVMHPQQTSILNSMALSLHETVPGHHLQYIYSLTSTIPRYRAIVEDDHYYRMPAAFPIFTAYMEGWGLYSEFLGEELGMYTDDYMLMGRYSEEIFRACRLVVDTGLNYFGWERERAIQYMLDNTAESRDSVGNEVNRYLTWPGQATAYKIGEIKIKGLRQKATVALGNDFHLKDFHSVILDNGGMSLSLLERVVDDWIAEVKATQFPAGSDYVGK